MPLAILDKKLFIWIWLKMHKTQNETSFQKILSLIFFQRGRFASLCSTILSQSEVDN